MVDHAITQSTVALFLGAGASNAFGKRLMGGFIDDLANDRAFANSGLFKAIIGVERDLEFLFEELTNWEGLRTVHSKLESSVRQNFSTFRERGLLGESQTQVEAFSAEATLLLQQLRQHVFNSYGSVNDEEIAQITGTFDSLFDDCFGSLFLTERPMVVFTTNYDTVVEDFCRARRERYKLTDGFRNGVDPQDSEWDRKIFDTFVPDGNRNDLVLFKLHGSALWKRHGGRVLKLALPIYSPEGASHENLLIYPVKTKVALEDPFFTAYDYFQRTIDNVQGLVVIGYSFRDYDALTKLISASRANRDFEVLVVDPLAEKLCADLKKRGIKVQSVRAHFGFQQHYSEHLPAVREFVNRAHGSQRSTKHSNK